jgi:hypothetical protein
VAYFTIVKLSDCELECCPVALVAVITSVKRPSLSVLEAEIRPAKETLFVPA